MNDYKELIEELRNTNFAVLRSTLSQAADAIEQLVNDRNASIDALKAIEDAICNYGERKDEVSE